MLKTLRITSLIALVAAVCGVITIAVFGLRGDSEILAFLAKPGVVDEAKEKIKPDDNKKEDESPLVTQLKAFALRIDPPPPPPKDLPKTERKDPPKKELVREKPKPRPVEPPRPPVQVNAKFTLLATVQCIAEPTRSMALLQQTGGKQEWFRQGERVGHLDIDEVRNGSVIFSQSGRNQQELFVPAKPQVKSILKDDNQPVASKAGPGSINVKFGDEPAIASVPEDASVPGQQSELAEVSAESGRVRLQRLRSEMQTSREPTERIRTRVAPRVRTPREQKASIEGNISSIQEIMSRDTSEDPDQKKKENEAWMKLLKALEGEKQNLEKVVEQVDESEDQPQSQEPQKNDEAESTESASDDSSGNDPNET